MASSSLAAGVIHLALSGDHLVHWTPIGFAFLLTGVAQSAAAVGFAITGSPLTKRAIISVNAAPLIAWGVSRTVGLPIGPDAWIPEAIGIHDLTAVMCEAMAIALVLRRAQQKQSVPAAFAMFPLLATLVSLAGTDGHLTVGPSHHSQLAHSMPALVGGVFLLIFVGIQKLRRR